MILMPKSIAHILTFWTPGSRDDDWTWNDEYRDLITKPETRYIHRQIAQRGIGFADQTDPVLLGDDGRVWDGHHRIILAVEYGVHELMVAFGETRNEQPI